MTAIYDYLEFIARLENTTFGKKNNKPISCEEVAVFIDFYLHADKAQREAISELIQGKMGLTLISYSGEMSGKAIDSGDCNWLKNALMLHIIEGCSFDYRENTRRLIFISYAASRTKFDLLNIVNSLEDISSNHAHQKLLDFCNRPSELNQLKSYGMKEVKVKNQTRFKPIT